MLRQPRLTLPKHFGTPVMYVRLESDLKTTEGEFESELKFDDVA